MCSVCSTVFELRAPMGLEVVWYWNVSELHVAPRIFSKRQERGVNVFICHSRRVGIGCVHERYRFSYQTMDHAALRTVLPRMDLTRTDEGPLGLSILFNILSMCRREHCLR